MQRALRRDLGVTGATLLGLGSVLGTGVYVTIGLAAGIAGHWVTAAVVVAALLALVNGLNSAQLAANHAFSGGAYEYGHVYLVPWAGFVAGWVFVAAKTASAATAAMGFAGYLLKATGLTAQYRPFAGVALVLAVTLIISAGIRRSNHVNGVIVALTAIALAAFCIVGALHVFSQPEMPYNEAPRADLSFDSFLHAVAIIFVAFTGYGRVATLGEEVKNPHYSIPKAIVATVLISARLYIAVSSIATTIAGPGRYAALSQETAAPLEIIALDFGVPGLSLLLALGAMTAMAGVLLNLILGISRVILAMARRGDLPAVFRDVDGSSGSPLPAVLLTGLIIIALVLLDQLKLTWSFSAFTVLLYYAINNLAALAIPREKKLFPGWLSVTGLLVCLALAWWVELSALVAGLLVVTGGIVWRIGFRWPTGT